MSTRGLEPVPQPAGEEASAATRVAKTWTGASWAVAAYAWWGVAPVYFKALRNVSPSEILAHRIVWSVVLLAFLAAVLDRIGTVFATVRTRRTLRLLLLSTALVACNWFVFIWAIAHEHLLQASLGYFINPLVSVLLGATVLRERLSRAEWIAVALAAAGVAWLAATAGTTPWVALFLAGSFALYGLVRKLAGVDAIAGLLVETTILLPLAVGYLLIRERSGTLVFGNDTATDALLLSAGLITTVPLLCFTVAIRALRLVTIGILQYIAPTLQLLLAVVVYHEPFRAAQKATFLCIWVALAIFTADNLRRAR